MGKQSAIDVGEHFGTFIEAQVNGGRYGDASEVVRAGLRLLEERETELEALRTALIEGETSGLSTPFDFEAFLADKRGVPETRG